MSGALDSLEKLLPPPPGDVMRPPWHESAAEVGIDFPGDYRAFVDHYGGGAISIGPRAPRFFIYAPHSQPRGPGGSAGFRALVEETDEGFGPDFDGGDPEHWGGPTYQVGSQPGGLLAWGETEDGDVFFWLTGNPDPNRWPVVMWARGLVTSYRFEGGMVEFLLAVFSGNHPASQWLTKEKPWWTMESDWLRADLKISFGSAP